MHRLTTTATAVICSALIGCGQPNSQAPQSAVVSVGDNKTVPAPAKVLVNLSEKQTEQKQVAIAAKDLLFEKLSGRLMSVLKSDGPVSAITVCKGEAAGFSAQVEKELGVRIGRTSFKLRNSANTGPDWTQEFVTAKTETPTFVSLPNDELGALLPIRLKEKCLLCHGDQKSLKEDVREALALQYPHDEATGFSEGDLRGWFWVEVPAEIAAGENSPLVALAEESADEKPDKDDADTEEAHGPMGHGPGFGRGPGRGRGPGGGRGRGMMGDMRGDMTTLHAMFDARAKIKRTVKMLPQGAEAVTESDDKKIAALIQEHVPAMEDRVHEDNPLPPMTFHPVFVELIKHAEDYTLTYEDTDKGIKVTYDAKDPFVIMLVQEHAKLVSRFIKNGMEEIHKPYELPKIKTAMQGADESDKSKALGITPPLPSEVKDPADNPSTPAKIELGKKLFFDPRLSLTGTVSCNSCHNVMEGGDDGRPSSMGIHGRLGPRNAPTVWNSAFQASQFWDGRAPSLEDQAKGPPVAGPEMGMPNHDKVVERIAAIPGYQTEFAEVFGEDAPVTIDNAVKAIAAFERTLLTPNSPYDQYTGGDSEALNEQQLVGMKLFDSVGCTECHSGPAFNGWEIDTKEPSFQKFPRFAESEFVKQYDLAADPGRSNVTKQDADRNYFKVPTLRNITITAPYFHNGAVESLSEAVRIMAGTELDTELSDKEVADIVAFLTSLEGEFPEITLPRLPSRPGQSVLDNQEPAATNH